MKARRTVYSPALMRNDNFRGCRNSWMGPSVLFSFTVENICYPIGYYNNGNIGKVGLNRRSEDYRTLIIGR